MLDMGTHPPKLVRSLRNLPGLTQIQSPNSPASAPGGMQTTRMGFDPSTAVSGPDDAERFVADRVAEGSDYIKIIAVPTLVMMPGTAAPGAPFNVRHGEALHDELALLAAQWFGLKGRGAIAPGLRADLLLLDGDPTADTTATQNIQGI